MKQLTAQTRQCKSCKTSRPIGDFHSSGDGKTKRWVCKECRNTKNQAYYLEKTRNTYLQSHYGMSLAEYEALLTEQSGVCAICGSLPDDINLHVDHNHTTGAVRGLLCMRCNIALGNFKDDLDTLLSAALYLLAHETE